MFMRENRKKNGAPQPEQTQAKDGAGQRSARQLSPNDPLPPRGDDNRFSPDMSTPQSINEDHYSGGVSGAGAYGKTYEERIPHVGPVKEVLPPKKLKSR